MAVGVPGGSGDVGWGMGLRVGVTDRLAVLAIEDKLSNHDVARRLRSCVTSQQHDGGRSQHHLSSTACRSDDTNSHKRFPA